MFSLLSPLLAARIPLHPPAVNFAARPERRGRPRLRLFLPRRSLKSRAEARERSPGSERRPVSALAQRASRTERERESESESLAAGSATLALLDFLFLFFFFLGLHYAFMFGVSGVAFYPQASLDTFSMDLLPWKKIK